MKRLRALLIPLSVLLLTACATEPVSNIHRISGGQYLVKISQSLSETPETTTDLVLDTLATSACQGEYIKTKQWLFPDPYWDEVVVYWEVSCGLGLQQLTQSSKRTF